MRRVLIAVLLAAFLAALLLPDRAVQEGDLGYLLYVDDHFLSLDKTDRQFTTAAVHTGPPGVVMLPRSGSGDVVALRPGALQLVVVEDNRIRGYSFSGSSMVPDPRLEVAFPGVRAVAWTSDGRFLAAASDSRVRVWGLDSEGRLRQISQWSLAGSELVALEGGPGADLWLVEQRKAVRYGFTGSGWAPLAGDSFALEEGKAASWDSRRQALAVLDGSKVRCFALSASGFVEVLQWEAEVAGACGVAVHGLGYSVIVGRTARSYGYGPAGVVRIPALDLDLGGEGLGAATSPWGEFEWVAVTPWGVRYAGWGGSGWVFDPARSVAGAIGGGVIADHAEFRSVVFPALVPVFKVRLEVEAQVPAGSEVRYEVSTDGGSRWVELVPGVNTLVPEGNAVVYRMLLFRGTSARGPEVDRVVLAQIAYRYLPGRVGGFVRLVK